MLEHVNHNGHDGRWMELTLMRNWVQTHLIYEYALSLSEGAHDMECAVLNEIIKTQAQQ